MTTANWYENNEFWQTWGPMMFSKQRLTNTPAEVDRFLSLLKIPANAHVLDLCCGVGRHSLELARRGFKVAGVDRMQAYLEQAREAATKENLDVEFVCEDMRNFLRPNAFDLVINLFTSFGFFEGIEEDRKVARNMFGSLKRGGILLMDMSGKEILAREFRERDWREVDGIYWLEERKILDDWSRIQNRWIMFKDGQRFENTICPRLYSAAELRSLLHEVEFKKLNFYGGFDGSPYDSQARRLVVVARK
jgi:SAM-dependent methyltransferase